MVRTNRKIGWVSGMPSTRLQRPLALETSLDRPGREREALALRHDSFELPRKRSVVPEGYFPMPIVRMSPHGHASRLMPSFWTPDICAGSTDGD
jgi:hypothetical protein